MSQSRWQGGGRYDIVTAQGESGSFVNKVYLNSGAPDVLRPVVTDIRADAPPAFGAATVVRAKVRDQVMDDGVSYVTGSAYSSVRTASTPAAAGVGITPGGLSQSAVAVQVAQSVLWFNSTAAVQTVQLTSAPHDYVVAALSPGQSVEHVLPRAGSYSYTVSPAGFAGTITVSGATGSTTVLSMGGGQHRAALTDPTGVGNVLFFELEFRDGAGNRRVTSTGWVDLLNCAVSVYCTAKLNSLACLPAIAASGTASASNTGNFSISAGAVLNQKLGLLFYGYSPAATSYQGGFLCVGNPLRRTGPQNSGGSASGSDCSGVFAFDFNAWIASGGDPLLTLVGQQVNAQYWSRDPADPFTTNLTDAVSFKICP